MQSTAIKAMAALPKDYHDHHPFLTNHVIIAIDDAILEKSISAVYSDKEGMERGKKKESLSPSPSPAHPLCDLCTKSRWQVQEIVWEDREDLIFLPTSVTMGVEVGHRHGCA